MYQPTPAQIHVVAWAEGLRRGVFLASPRRDVILRARTLGLVEAPVFHDIDRGVTGQGWRPYWDFKYVKPTAKGLALLAA